MEQVSWWQGFFAPSIWDIIPLVGLVGSGAVIAVIKKVRDTWGVPLLYGIAGGGIVFICLWLPIQLNQHFNGMKRLSYAQTAVLEKLANDQQQVLQKLILEQRQAEVRPSRSEILRPYFTLTKAEIKNIPKRGLQLSVFFGNNEVVAKNVVSHLLAISDDLESDSSLIHTVSIESANPVGPRQPFIHQWRNINHQNIRRLKFIVIQIRYNNTQNDETYYSQSLYLKFEGVDQDGTFTKALSHANSDEKSRLLRYMEKRGIS